MNISLPAAGVQAGRTAGGGLLDKLTGGAGAQGADPAAGPKGDGSVGLFDGVLSKALIGGAVGAGVGFLPFIPGGPILGGIVGALVGAGYGMFKNWKTMKAIREENAAFIGQLGVTPPTQQHAQALIDGQPTKLLELTPEPGQGAPGQGAPGQGVPGQGVPGQGVPGQGVPGQGVPGQGVPGQGVPGQGVPGQGVPGQGTPGQGTQQSAYEQVEAQYAAQQKAQEEQLAAYIAQQQAQQGAPSASQAAAQQAAQAPPTATGVIAQGADPASVLPGQAGAPPLVVDASTQPNSGGNAAIAPKQAELAAGGGEEKPVTAAAVWADATPEQQRNKALERLERQIEELQATVRRLQAQVNQAA